jgi:nucleoside-diphosphate-sugar epimerase
VETDARLLNKISHPLRGDSRKLRAATGWAPTVSFVELVARLMHEAEEPSSKRASAQPT